MKNLKEKYLFELKDILGDDIVLRELSDDELVRELIGSYALLLEKRDDIEELEEQVRELEREIAGLESKNASLERENRELSREVDTLETTNASLNDKIEDLGYGLTNFNSGTP